MSQIKDKKIAVFEVLTGRDLNSNEIKIKRYIHGHDGLNAYVRECSEKEKNEAKAAGVEQSVVLKVNYNERLKVGHFIDFRGEVLIIQSIDGFEFYKRDLTLRAARVKAEVYNHEEYTE